MNKKNVLEFFKDNYITVTHRINLNSEWNKFDLGMLQN